MKVTLHTMFGLKEVIGQRLTVIELPTGAVMADFLATLGEKWGEPLKTYLFQPESGELLPYVRIMVNGQAIDFLQGLETPLNEGDEVLILPPASGG